MAPAGASQPLASYAAIGMVLDGFERDGRPVPRDGSALRLARRTVREATRTGRDRLIQTRPISSRPIRSIIAPSRGRKSWSMIRSIPASA